MLTLISSNAEFTNFFNIMNAITILVCAILLTFATASIIRSSDRPVRGDKQLSTKSIRNNDGKRASSSRPLKRRLISAARIQELDNDLKRNPLVMNSSDPQLFLKLQALRQDVHNSGCNINLCFVIQGDEYTDMLGFYDQTTFADLVANILTTDEAGGLCAVQYGRSTTVISALTDRRELFFERLDEAAPVGGYDSNIGGALGYAMNQLAPRLEDANKVILFADGMRTTGYPPSLVAKELIGRRMAISAVGVGKVSIAGLKQIVNDDNLIYQISAYFEIIEVADALVRSVCGIDK